jgi:tetratricopeptide (TPR) repeat protein
LQLINRKSSASFFAASVLAAIVILPMSAVPGFAGGATPEQRGTDAQALIRAGHWKRARAILEPQVKTHPDDAMSCYLLAEVKMSFKDLDGALPPAQHAVDLDGGKSNFHLELGKVFGEMASHASIFSAGSLAVKFRKEVEVAIQIDPKNIDALDAMMQFKYQAPGMMGGSKDEARDLADKITTLDPSEGNLSHAELAELEKDAGQMESFYLRAVQANPRNYDARTSLAKFYSQSSHAKYDEAVKQANSAIQLDPGRAEAYWIRARVFALQQRWSDLDQTVADAQKNVPDDLRPLYEASQGLLEIGQNLAKAEDYARKYLSQEPEGEEPDAADGHRLLGLVLEKEGRNADARSEMKTALQLRPNFKAAKEDLKRLEN